MSLRGGGAGDAEHEKKIKNIDKQLAQWHLTALEQSKNILD